jgi:hypothetical protein
MKGNIGYNVLVKQIQYLFICFKVNCRLLNYHRLHWRLMGRESQLSIWYKLGFKQRASRLLAHIKLSDKL